MFKKIIKKLTSIFGLGYIVTLIEDGSALLEDGWILSNKNGKPVSKNGEPIPWMTYSFISYIEKCLNKNMKVFEYGSGNSTLWWAKHVKNVVACEHDSTWFAQIEKKMPSNVALNFSPLDEGTQYSSFIKNYKNEFDIIVIDGRDRINCAKNSLNALTDNGVVIWDNSDRDEYNDGFKYLLSHGFRRLDFCGMGPINSYKWCTSIFYKSGNIFNI